MSRLRLAACLVLAAVAVVAAFVAAALTATRQATPSPDVPQATPSDLIADLVLPAGIRVSTGRLEQHGISRTWLVLAPETPARGLDPATLPLLVGLHGRNATPGEEADRDQLLPYVAAGRAVLVYPVGYDQAWNVDDGCCGLAPTAGLDDVAFVGRVVDAVRSSLGLAGPTDLVGFSNGGRLAFAIACRDAARYTALVAVAATPTTSSCPDAHVPVPLFAAATLDDTELPTHEQPRPVAQVVGQLQQAWTARDGCTGPPVTGRPGEATVTTWTSCAAGTVVQTVTWPHGGHVWPQDADVGTPDTAQLAWAFLSRFGPPAPAAPIPPTAPAAPAG